MNDHAFQGWSASYVLGALEPQERREFEEHLAGCDRCRREVNEFTPLPGLLAKARPEDVEPAPRVVTTNAVRRARAEWVNLDRSRRRWRWVAGAATAVAAAVLLVPTLFASSDSDAVWQVDSPIASGSVSLESKAWGTAIHLDLSDLPRYEGYIAWVVDLEGNAQQVAAWSPTDSGRGVLASASSIGLEHIQAVAVTDLSGDERILTAEP